jgi:predicted  nucleic acid-binding Zn-ribbon protein
MSAENTPADESTSDGTDDSGAADAAVIVHDRLIDLQRVDTEADQLMHERENSPLRDDLATKSDQLAAWERRRGQMRARIDELTESIEKAEEDGAELTAHRQRLDKQMKTIIAPREAEALTHEMATIDGQRDELDMAEMEALEEQSALDDELAAHLNISESVADAARLADGSLAVAVTEIDGRLSALNTERESIRAEIDSDLLTKYDRVRDALGVAVAELAGRQCLGCHIDLSAAEVDTVKDDAAHIGIAECPQCGRMLIV